MRAIALLIGTFLIGPAAAVAQAPRHTDVGMAFGFVPTGTAELLVARPLASRLLARASGGIYLRPQFGDHVSTAPCPPAGCGPSTGTGSQPFEADQIVGAAAGLELWEQANHRGWYLVALAGAGSVTSEYAGTRFAFTVQAGAGILLPIGSHGGLALEARWLRVPSLSGAAGTLIPVTVGLRF